MKVKILSPAKINLFLEVIGRRQDGFHEIKTVLQEIDLCDELLLRSTASGIALSSECKDIPLDDRNLAYRAAKIFFSECKIRKGVRIEILKRIPVAAGLGGGSSNAACTLLALDKLFGTRLSLEKLLVLAEKLGSDVPFFIRGVPSVAIGRGAEVVPLGSYLPFCIILACPQGLSTQNKTAEVYKALNIGLTNGSVPITITIAAIEAKRVNTLSASLFNRLESVVRQRVPLVKEIRQFMESNGASGVLVSGAGPTVFGIVSDKALGKKLEKKIGKRFGGRVFTHLAKTLAGTPAPYYPVV